MFDWIGMHPELSAWLAVASGAMLLAGILIVPFIVARMPADHFLREVPGPGSWRGRHPAISVLVQVGRNLLGVLLVLAGIAMLVLPGQGILTILVGLSLLTIPGKRRLEIRILKLPGVRNAIDWLRSRAGRERLQLPGDESA